VKLFRSNPSFLRLLAQVFVLSNYSCICALFGCLLPSVLCLCIESLPFRKLKEGRRKNKIDFGMIGMVFDLREEVVQLNRGEESGVFT
jgi:hypothetical protein